MVSPSHAIPEISILIKNLAKKYKYKLLGSPQSPLHEQHSLEFLKHWWHIFDTDIKPSLTKMVHT